MSFLALALLGASILADQTQAETPSSFQVSWSTESFTSEVVGQPVIDYALYFSVEGASSPSAPRLFLRHCQQLAGERAFSCQTGPLAYTLGTNGIRWGVDPSSYHVGTNLYTFELLLTDGRRASSDLLEIVLEVVRE